LEGDKEGGEQITSPCPLKEGDINHFITSSPNLLITQSPLLKKCTFVLPMYGKEELIELKQKFWQAFDERMKKHRSASSNSKVNWAHYRTNINHIYFRLETNINDVKLCIDLQHKDAGIRELFYEQFIEVRKVMQSFFEDELVFEPSYFHPNGLEISRIYVVLNNVNYLDEQHHNAVLRFFREKPTQP
jgi:hypothetical protein